MDKNEVMTNYLLAIVYQEKVEGSEDEYITKVNKFFLEDSNTYKDCVEKTKAFIINECNFEVDEIPQDELEGLVTNFGVWDEKEVLFHDGEEEVAMPFIKANALEAKRAFEIKRDKLVKGLDKDAKDIRPKGIKFTEAEATSGRERILQIMSTTIENL